MHVSYYQMIMIQFIALSTYIHFFVLIFHCKYDGEYPLQTTEKKDPRHY